jgi:hypothetical protein
MTNTLRNLRALESILVQEFRISQVLLNSLEEERLAIIQEDVPHLVKLSGKKEELLEKLGDLISVKNKLFKELDDDFGTNLLNQQRLLPRNLCSAVDHDSARRLMHLQEGVVVIMSQVRELNQGNQALSLTALPQENELQAKYLENYLKHRNNLEELALADKPKVQNPQTVTAEISKQVTKTALKQDKELINQISDLYQQEAIYQVVMKLNASTLTNV